MKRATRLFRRSGHCVMMVFVVLAPGSGMAQESPTRGDALAVRSGMARRVDVGPTSDGLLDEAVWASAHPMTGFVQY